MEARILKIDEKPSSLGGTFYYFFFKEISTGKSYRSCISSQMRNFVKWAPVIKAVQSREDVVLSGLVYNSIKRVIDADSDIRRVGAERPAPVEVRPQEKVAASTNALEHIKNIRAMLDKKVG